MEYGAHCESQRPVRNRLPDPKLQPLCRSSRFNAGVLYTLINEVVSSLRGIVRMPIDNVVRPLTAIFTGFWTYLRAWELVRIKYRENSHGSHTYHSEEAFWFDLIGRDTTNRASTDRLSLGDVVELKEFVLSEWFSRLPGTYWTKEGTRRRIWAEQQLESWHGDTLVLTPAGKSELVTGGVGTMRVFPHGNGGEERYGVLCITSSGRCDAGIPLVVHETEYMNLLDQLTERRNSGKSVEISLKARLCGLPFQPKDLLVAARGARIPEMLEESVLRSLGVPRYFLRIESPLQVSTFLSDRKVKASAWTLYSDDEGAWSYTYSGFDVNTDGEIERAVEFLNEYVRRHRGNKIYTDFDEHVPRLDAVHALAEVMENKVEPGQDIDDFFRWSGTVGEARERWNSR